MPLITLHTRLVEVLAEARAVKNYCAQAADDMELNLVSANAVVGLAQRFQAAIAGVIEPAQGHVGLPEYAALQFNDPDFGLAARLAGMKVLLQGAIAAARATLPVTGEGYILKDTWNADGSVSVRQLQPAETAALCAALRTIHDNIPE